MLTATRLLLVEARFCEHSMAILLLPPPVSPFFAHAPTGLCFDAKSAAATTHRPLSWVTSTQLSIHHVFSRNAYLAWLVGWRARDSRHRHTQTTTPTVMGEACNNKHF